jgi:hypothetical protein
MADVDLSTTATEPGSHRDSPHRAIRRRLDVPRETSVRRKGSVHSVYPADLMAKGGAYAPTHRECFMRTLDDAYEPRVLGARAVFRYAREGTASRERT